MGFVAAESNLRVTHDMQILIYPGLLNGYQISLLIVPYISFPIYT